jgi:hypothetical protein
MKTLIFSILISTVCFGQTALDLSKQSKNVNFSNAQSTTPWKMGSVLPVTCNTGEVFFNTSANNGLNINLCLSNSWVAFTGALGSIPVQTGSAGFYLRTNGSTLSWSNIVTGSSGAIDCATLPGVCDISTALVPMKSVANTWTGANDFSGATFLKVKRAAGDPSTGCSLAADVGSVYVRSDGAADNNLWICESNGGSPRWRRPTDAISLPAMTTTNQGHFWLGEPAATGSSGEFVAGEPRCWEFVNPLARTRVGTASAILDTADALGFASLAIYAPDDTLLGQSDTISTANTGKATFTFSPALNLTGSVYTACLATSSITANFRASSVSDGATLLLRSLASPRLFTAQNLATGSGPLLMPSTLGTRSPLATPLLPVGIIAEP